MGQCNEIIDTQLCIYACILYMFTYTLNCFLRTDFNHSCNL